MAPSCVCDGRAVDGPPAGTSHRAVAGSPMLMNQLYGLNTVTLNGNMRQVTCKEQL